MYHMASCTEEPTLPSTLSSEARSFVLACVDRNPSTRWTMAQLSTHLFLRSRADDDRKSTTIIPALPLDTLGSVPDSASLDLHYDASSGDWFDPMSQSWRNLWSSDDAAAAECALTAQIAQNWLHHVRMTRGAKVVTTEAMEEKAEQEYGQDEQEEYEHEEYYFSTSETSSLEPPTEAFVVRTIAAYVGNAHEEILSFNAHERIEILNDDAAAAAMSVNGGWWIGRKLETGEVGWCPSTYVERELGWLEEENDLTEDFETEEEEAYELVYVRVMTPYPGNTELNVLTLETGQILRVMEHNHASGWWKGCLDEQDPGWFPCTVVEYLDPVVVALEEYQDLEGERNVLTLHRGESLTVLRRHSSGWSQGQKMETGEIGWYPSDYVEWSTLSCEDEDVYSVTDDDLF